MTSQSILATFPVSLPPLPIPNTNPSEIARLFTSRLNNLSLTDFTPSDATWRDSFALTGTLRTFYSASTVTAAWTHLLASRQACHFDLSTDLASVNPNGWIDVPFTFQTQAAPAATCSGYLSVTRVGNGDWKIFMLRTILELLNGLGDVDALDPNPNDNPNHDNKGTDFDCVVIGGGQAGLSTAGRLQALHVRYVVIEKNENVGDNWLRRYDSMKLHTIRETAHLPFDRTFGTEYAEYLDKYDLAKGYRSWVGKYGINIWLSTELISGVWDDERKMWTLDLNLHRQNRHQVITCSHVVVAAGASGQKASMPEYPGKETFQGIVMHSEEYQNSTKWKGKYGVIVGTANTEDMLDAGLASVTMIQRSRTYVMPAEYSRRNASAIYNPNIPISTADRLALSPPLPISRLMIMKRLHSQASEEPSRFDALESAGFLVTRYGDLNHHLFERFGGHHVDTGCSAKIARKLIKVKTTLIAGYTPHGLSFQDGSETKADVIVFATGFRGNLRETARELFGQDVYNAIEDFWGVDGEGEIKGAFKPCGHPGLWFIGGTTSQARYFSRFIALQVRASVSGVPLTVYRETPEKVV